MTEKNKSELGKQIEAYGLKNKLKDLARKEEARRPFRHLPKQFSKGILIGNIAIVPKKHTGTRYVYVLADMMEAKILHHVEFEEDGKDEHGYPITAYTKEGDPVIKALVPIPVPYLKDEVISIIHYLHDNRKKLKKK